MSVPSLILSEIYEVLSNYDESPKMTKDTFVHWYAKNNVYTISVELKTLMFVCNKPFQCQVVRKSDFLNAIPSNKIDKTKFESDPKIVSDKQLKDLNKKIAAISSKYYGMRAFW